MRERIIDCAWRQVLKHGVKRFTMQDIASELGISKKTIYAYFEGKEAIIAALVEKFTLADKTSHCEAMQAQVGFFEKLNMLIDAHSHRLLPLGLLTELKRYYPEIINQYVSPNFPGELYSELLSMGIQEGYIRSDIHPVILELIIEKCVEALDDSRFLSEHDISVQHALGILKSVILYGSLVPDKRDGGTEM